MAMVHAFNTLIASEALIPAKGSVVKHVVLNIRNSGDERNMKSIGRLRSIAFYWYRMLVSQVLDLVKVVQEWFVEYVPLDS